MNEHDQVEEANRVRRELRHIHVSGDYFALGWVKLLVLLGQAKGGRHAFVSNMVREEIHVVAHSFHQNDRIGRKGLRDLPVEVGFADVRHGEQLDSLAVLARVFPHLNRKTTRAQCHEAFAEVVYRQGSAHDEIDNHRGHQHNDVCEQEYRQVPPAKAPGRKACLGNQRPLPFKPAVDQVQDAETEDDLAQRNDPGNLLKPTKGINGKWNYDQHSYGIEERKRKEQVLGDHWYEPHQDVNQERDEHRKKAHHRAGSCEGVNAKNEDQRVIQEGNECIGQKQPEAHAQQESNDLSPG